MNEKFHARQNVIFELGYFTSKLGRNNVVTLYDTSSTEIEIPSDISGVLYVPYDNPEGSWHCQQLKPTQGHMKKNMGR
jgi:predicted nucleotide-binding protein